MPKRSQTVGQVRSPPPRGRGLKPFASESVPRRRPVAPPAGARIETISRFVDSTRWKVAPPAGARIETEDYKDPESGKRHVAPPAGARIETHNIAMIAISAGGSPPPRGRGLKPARL